MRYAIKLITAPADEPVTPNEVLNQDLIGDPQQVSLVLAYITAAREYCETVTHRQFITATWQMTLDTFPRSAPYYGGVGENYREINLPAYDQTLYIPNPPLQSITSIQYIDMTNTLQTWNSSQYLVDVNDEPGRITPGFGIPWPIPLAIINSVTITFVAGYGTAYQVPQSIKHAIRLLASHWFALREPVDDAPLKEIPFMVTNLLNSKKWGSYILVPGLR